MSNILSSFFKKAKLNPGAVKEFIDNGSTETITQNTETSVISVDTQNATEISGINTKPSVIIKAVASSNQDTKITIPILRQKKTQAQVSLAYIDTDTGRQVDRFARALFTPVEKNLKADEYFTTNFAYLDTLKNATEKIDAFDSWVGSYTYGPLGGLKNCFTLKELLAFEKGKQNNALQSLRKVSKGFIDNIQTSPDITKVTKPYVSGDIKGFMLLDTFESTTDSFIISEIQTDSSTKTQLCVISSKKAIEVSDLFAPQVLQLFAEVTAQGYSSFYIHDKKMRLQFIYSFLKSTLARILQTIDLDTRNGRTNLDTEMTDFFTRLLNDHFEQSKETFMKYMLGLYRFCSNYQAFLKYLESPTISPENQQHSLPEIKTDKNLNASSFGLLNVVDQIETDVTGAFLSQTYADLIYLPYKGLFDKLYDISTQTSYQKSTNLFQNLYREYPPEELREYYFNLFILQKMFIDYLKTGLVSRFSRSTLNFFELPKKFENCLGFVCEDRICQLKGDFKRGLWGFISSPISALDLYNQKTKGPKKINKKIFVRKNGEVFSNEILTVIDTAINKMSSETASKIIMIQRDFSAAFDKVRKKQKILKENMDGLTKAFSYGCGMLSAKQIDRLKGISHLVGQTAENNLTLEIDPSSSKITLRTPGQTSLEVFSTDSTFLTFRPSNKLTFQISPEMLPLLEALAETHEPDTNFFVNIVECKVQTSTKTKIEGQLASSKSVPQGHKATAEALAAGDSKAVFDETSLRDEDVLWSIAFNLDTLHSKTTKIETLNFAGFEQALRSLDALKTEKKRNMESTALAAKSTSWRAVGKDDGLFWYLARYPDDALDEKIGDQSQTIVLNQSQRIVLRQSQTFEVGEFLSTTEAFEFFETNVSKASRFENVNNTNTLDQNLLRKYTQCMLITSTQGIIIIPLQNMQKKDNYSFDSTYDAYLANNAKTDIQDVLNASDKNELLAEKVLSSFSLTNLVNYTIKFAKDTSGLQIENMPKYVEIQNSFSPICPYRLIYKIGRKVSDIPETVFEQLLTKDDLLEIQSEVQNILNNSIQGRTTRKTALGKEFYELPSFVGTLNKSQKVRSHFEGSLGFVLFRDVWSSGYTLQGLAESNLIKFDNQTGALLTESRDFLEGLYSKKTIAFNRGDDLKYSLFMTPLVDASSLIAIRQQKLIDAYRNIENENEKEGENDTLSFEKYLAENQKEFCYYPKTIFEYYEKEVLENEIRKYFPEYFASIVPDPVNISFEMDLRGYPENATKPDAFHEILVDLLMRAKYEFTQKPTSKNFYDVTLGTSGAKSQHERVPAENYPTFCTKDGFAGYLLNALIPLVLVEKNRVKKKGENISPFRFRIYLKADISSGWINADLAVAKGINLMPQANSFHIVELMSPVSFISRNTQGDTKIPFWQAIVEHYENQGIQVAFVQSTETIVRAPLKEKMPISVTSAFPPNFFLLNRDKFYGEGGTSKWYEDRSFMSWRTTIEINDPFLIDTGFYYYLGVYNPAEGGAVSIQDLGDVSKFSDAHRRLITSILTSMLDLASDIERREALAAKAESLQTDDSTRKDLETRFAFADLGYVKLVNWWIDLLPDDREYFFAEYIQPRGRLSLQKIKIPQHFNAHLPKKEMPEAMQKHPQADSFELYPYQKQAVNAALNQKRIVLNMEMGLGKTITAITTFFKLKENPQSGIDRMLIIVPKTPQKSWLDEMRDRVENGSSLCEAVLKFQGTKAFAAIELLDNFKKGKKPILIFNENEVKYDPNFSSSEKVFWKLVEVLTEVGSSTLLVIDEMHKFKNPEALQSKGLTYISKLCDRVIGMTGTLKPNTVIDYYTCVETVAPGTFGMSAEDFINNFCLTGLKGKMRESTFNPLKLEDFYRISAPFVFSRVIDGTAQSTNLESVYIPLPTPETLTPHIDGALDSIQKFLMAAMELIIAVNTLFKSEKSQRTKEIQRELTETRASISAKKAEIKGLEKTKRYLSIQDIEGLRSINNSLNNLKDDVTSYERRLTTQMADLDAAAKEDPFSVFKQHLLSGTATGSSIAEQLKSGSEDNEMIPFEVNWCTVAENIWLAANSGKENLVPEFYKLAAIASPESGGFNDLHEQLVLSPWVFVNARIVKLEKLDKKEQSGLVEKYDLKNIWDKIIPKGYVSKKVSFIANAVLKELEDNPKLNCLVFGWYIESIKDLQKLLQTSSLPKSKTILGPDAVEIIYGETDSAKRPDILNGFNGTYEDDEESSKRSKKDYNKIRVLIAQLATLNTGVNLQKRCKFVAFLTTPWEATSLTQGQARVWRNGQKNTVSILRPTCTDLDKIKEQTLKAKIIGDSQSSGTSGAGNQSITQGLTNINKGGLDTNTLTNVQRIEDILNISQYDDIRIQASDCDIPPPEHSSQHEQQQFAYYNMANAHDLPKNISDLQYSFCRFGIDRDVSDSEKPKNDSMRILSPEFLNELKAISTQAIEELEGSINEVKETDSRNPVKSKLLAFVYYRYSTPPGTYKPDELLEYYRLCKQYSDIAKNLLKNIVTFNDQGSLVLEKFDSNYKGYKNKANVNVNIKESTEARAAFYKALAEYMLFANAAYLFGALMFKAVVYIKEQETAILNEITARGALRSLTKLMRTKPQMAAENTVQTVDIFPYEDFAAIQGYKYPESGINVDTFATQMKQQLAKYMNRQEFNFISKQLQKLLVEASLDSKFVRGDLYIGPIKRDFFKKIEMNPDALEAALLAPDTVRNFLGRAYDPLVANNISYEHDFRMLMSPLFLYLLAIQRVYTDMLLDMAVSEIRYDEEFYTQASNVSNRFDEAEKFLNEIDPKKRSFEMPNNWLKPKLFASDIGARIKMKMNLEYPNSPTGILKALANIKVVALEPRLGAKEDIERECMELKDLLRIDVFVGKSKFENRSTLEKEAEKKQAFKDKLEEFVNKIAKGTKDNLFFKESEMNYDTSIRNEEIFATSFSFKTLLRTVSENLANTEDPLSGKTRHLIPSLVPANPVKKRIANNETNDAYNTQFAPVNIRAPFHSDNSEQTSKSLPKWSSPASELRALNPLLLEATTDQKGLKEFFTQGVEIEISPAIAFDANANALAFDELMSEQYGSGSQIKRWTLPNESEIFRNFGPFKVLTYFNALSTCVSRIFVLKNEILALGKNLQKILQIDIRSEDVIYIYPVVTQGIPDLKDLEMLEESMDTEVKKTKTAPKNTTAAMIFEVITKMRQSPIDSSVPNPDLLATNYAELLACAGEFSAYCNLRNALCDILKDSIDVENTLEIDNLDEIANSVVEMIYSGPVYTKDNSMFKDTPSSYLEKNNRIQELRKFQKELKRAGATFDILEKMLGNLVKNIDKTKKPNQMYLITLVQTKCTEKGVSLQFMDKFATDAITRLIRT